jgi:FHA domain-containing protein
VLPDEQRQISRLQATVRFDEEGDAVLRNMSAVLPISVNGRTLRTRKNRAWPTATA